MFIVVDGSELERQVQESIRADLRTALRGPGLEWERFEEKLMPMSQRPLRQLLHAASVAHSGGNGTMHHFERHGAGLDDSSTATS